MESNLLVTNDSETNKKKRYDNIDLLKLISIFMVISMHIPLFFTDFINTHSINCFVQFGLRLISDGVLIFIFVNGFLLINKPFDLKKHIYKIIRMFFILLLWGTINVIIKSIIRQENLSITKIISEVLSLKLPHPYAGFLWFLQSLIGLYILFPLIKIVHDNNKKVYNYFAITIILFSVGINFVDIMCQLIGNLINVNNLSSLVLNNFNRINPYVNTMFLCYFILGGVVYEKRNIFENKKNITIAVILGILSWIIAIIYGYAISKLLNKTYNDGYNYNQIFLMITVIGLYALSTLYKNKNNNFINRFITSIGKNTMGIYLIHSIILEITKKYVNVFSLHFYQRLIISIGVLICSWIISIGIMKIPKLNSIIKI